MKELMLVPVVIASLLGMATELEALSMQAQQKTLTYSTQAVDAIECAIEARPLTDCSPNIMSPDVAEEIKKTHELSQHIRAQKTSLQHVKATTNN